MLEKKVSYDQQITESGVIQVRRITRILEDGLEIGKTYHRHCVSPGDYVNNEDERTKKIAGVVHTTEVILAYNKMVDESEELEDQKKKGGDVI